MNLREFIKSRRKKTVLFFLAGFFSGGILYFLCQKAAGDMLTELQENFSLWALSEQDFFQALLFVLWERGKTFGILWLAGSTRIYRVYICAFLSYVGMQSGFLLTFFMSVKGTKGLLCWLAAGVPHMFLLVPLYVYSFYRICEKRRAGIMPSLFFILIVFVLSCVLEVRGNIPLLQWIYP